MRYNPATPADRKARKYHFINPGIVIDALYI